MTKEEFRKKYLREYIQEKIQNRTKYIKKYKPQHHLLFSTNSLREPVNNLPMRVDW